MLLHDYLDYHARHSADHDCLIQDERTLSYIQLMQRCNQLANAFTEAGIGLGDRIALLAKNSIEMVVVYLAASKIGAVPVPLNWRFVGSEWHYILKDAEVKLIIADAQFCQELDLILNDLPLVEQTLAIGMEGSRQGWKDFDRFITSASVDAPTSNVCEEDVLYQMYTSGTTGQPKGVLITHHAVISNSVQFMPLFKEKLVQKKRNLIILPLFHAAAVSTVFVSLIVGSAMIIHKDFSAIKLVEALSEDRINMVNLVPAMIQAMLTEVVDLKERSFPDLEMIIYGASAIAEDTLRQAMAVFNCEFYQGYGQTESSAVISFLTAKDHQRALQDKPGLLLSAGRAILGTTIKIVDNKGNELPRGSIGEIIMRGPQVMSGYWNQQQETAATLVDGWLHTGDAAYMDDEGYIYIQDRIKDMVISGGENIYPREIENALFDHSDINDAAVIGIPDEQYGEALLAILVLRTEKSLTPDQIISYCRTKLAGYKVPRKFEFVKTLPRNASGKVLKKVLRAPYWQLEQRSI